MGDICTGCSAGEKVASNINTKMQLSYLCDDRLAEWKFYRRVGKCVCADTRRFLCVHVRPAIRVYGKLTGFDMTLSSIREVDSNVLAAVSLTVHTVTQ